MKIDELLSKVVPEKTIFQRRKDEIPLQMSSDGMIMNISDKRYTTQYPMKKEDIVYADDWEIIEKVFPKPLKVDFFEAYHQMRKGKIVCRYRKDKKYKEKDFFLLDNAHGIVDKAGCARTFSQVELDAIDWVIVRDGYFSMWRKEFVDKGGMFVSLDEYE